VAIQHPKGNRVYHPKPPKDRRIPTHGFPSQHDKVAYPGDFFHKAFDLALAQGLLAEDCCLYCWKPGHTAAVCRSLDRLDEPKKSAICNGAATIRSRDASNPDDMDDDKIILAMQVLSNPRIAATGSPPSEEPLATETCSEKPAPVDRIEDSVSDGRDRILRKVNAPAPAPCTALHMW
jgi:hypothetical protein